MEGDEEDEGVLLYYKYTDTEVESLGGREGLRRWYEDTCGAKGLVGRVRVARDGINATLGGTMAKLRLHCVELAGFEGFEGIDYKLARSPGSLNEAVEVESGFDQLSVQLTEEVVSLGPRAVGVHCEKGGKHLKPLDFHRMLSEADGEEEVVLIDVRNVYESRIGNFQCDGVETLLPATRTFNQFPRWVDSVENDLRDKKIMMYCTGGVRCEKASAYIKSKGPAFSNCFQLSGGIQRYLEAFPDDGGYFRGKNFVFDSRSSVPPERHGGAIISKCASCGRLHDDYGQRVRCDYCRLLLLLCPACLEEAGDANTKRYCEVCRAGSVGPADALGALGGLRLLCLHGFRQTAKSFRGRTAALRKRMKTVGFEYLDAPFTMDAAASGGAGGRRSWHPAPKGSEGSELRLDGALAEGFAMMGEAGGGWQVSRRYLKDRIEASGPFDGILAFSQGAALVCAALAHGDRLGGIKFVVLCSGYRPDDTPPIRGYLEVPSLHIFGGSDKQVPLERSEDLAEAFHPSTRSILRHNMGHIIPSSKTYVTDYARVIASFLEG
ncbi:rhodanese-like domain-containing protein [Chloropicon primus]|uniref:Rhodanese-like domain-containing protein n=1 Tax=Chloropicon primus TaxID=1764295 RepID=A0A5B8MK37_9CHLO|nr:rhodanese-like domain-containing protein [Chloropicon primus]|eukprot:QDZ19750.1 rhodanese-like domain-containing protein [Chloropicon primus]